MPPENIDLPPGDRIFQITATSLSKEQLKLLNPSITRNIWMKVPEIINFNIELDLDLYDGLDVYPNKEVAIKFYGGNWGNLNDS